MHKEEMNMKRILSVLLCLTLAFGLLTGCGGSSKDAMELAPQVNGDYNYSADYAPGENAGAEFLTSDTKVDSTIVGDRKLIKTVYLNAETETYDVLMDSLNQQITALGGYVESRDSNTGRSRRTSMVIRIPADALAAFVEHVNSNANVTSSSETAQDVTLEYVDTESKITALETEQARLLELLAGAESLEDILTIEARLSDVTYELERFASRLRSLSNQVDYATVHLTVYEVEVLTPVEEPTVWQRISTGFRESLTDLGDNLTDLFVWVIVESPNLVVFGILVSLVVFILRKNRSHHRPRPTKAPPTDPTA